MLKISKKTLKILSLGNGSHQKEIIKLWYTNRFILNSGIENYEVVNQIQRLLIQFGVVKLPIVSGSIGYIGN